MNNEPMTEIDDDDAVLTLDGPLAGAVVTLAPPVTTDHELDALYGEDEDIEDLSDDLDVDDHDDLAAAETPAAVVTEDPRVAELTATVEKLKAAELERESRRVKSKVKAATGGAGLAGIIPIVLQLTGALNVDPEIASAVVGGVAVLGAFIAGWVTPERQSAIVNEALNAK
jgi:hypothetical protein